MYPLHFTRALAQAVVVFLDRNTAHFPESLPENILPAKAAGKLMRRLEKVTSGTGSLSKNFDDDVSMDIFALKGH